MKQIKLIAIIAFVFSMTSLNAQWGIYKSGVSINGGYYDCELGTAAPDFQHNNFGQFTSGGTMTLNFAEVLTFKGGSDNACGATLHYRVHRTCDAPGSFNTMTLAFCCNNGGTDCGGGACGPDVSNTGDQKWKGNSGVNLLSGLTAPGVYVIEVYFTATGGTGSTSSCAETDFSSNSSANFRAYFELNMSDSFTDSDFSANPIWSGDTRNFMVVNNSRSSGLLGTEANRTHTIQLAVPSGAGSQYLSTPVTFWDSQQEWYFWAGRNDLSGGQDLSDQNQQVIWLYADQANLESTTIDGYRLLLGETTITNLQLQRVDNGTATTIWESTAGISNGCIDYGVAYKISRSQTGVWTVYSSTLPNNSTTQSTPTPLSCVETSANVNHGGTTDNTYVPSGTGYWGFMAIHSSGAAGRTTAEFDNFRFRPIPPSTQVQIINSTSATIDEDVLPANNGIIELQLVNPSSTVSTSVDVVLTSGTASRLGRGLTASTAYPGPYTTVTVTWNAMESGPKTLYLDPDDDDLCNDVATLNFQLQNIVGGNSAFIGTANSFTLNIVDDNMGYDSLLVRNFESNGTTGWITNGTPWAADQLAPINTTSLHHLTAATNGQSSIAYPMDDACLPGATTTWRFNLKYPNDPSANNNFQVFLAANEANLFSSTVDGYALVVDQTALPLAVSPTDEFIRLYRVTDNAYNTTPIISSAVEWVDNVNGGGMVGIEVVLTDNGTWTLRVDTNGNFDNLVQYGTGTDVTYSSLNFFGPRLKYTAGTSGFFKMDDLSIVQKGCQALWYSRANGNHSANNVWSATPSGSTVQVYPGRYSRFVVQNGHTVTNAGTWICQDVTIQNGGTINSGSGNMKVFGQWINDGAHTQGSSTVTFKGNANQAIMGAATTNFNNLVIDNDGSIVTCNSNVRVHKVLTPKEGVVNANNKLTIFSDGSTTGSIGPIEVGAAVTDSIILIRHIPSIPWVYGDWVCIGSPLIGQTINDWNDDIITTGFTGADYPSSSFNNIRYYNEITPGSTNTGYVGAANITESMPLDRGYMVWMQGAIQTIDMIGEIRSGSFTQPLSFTGTSAPYLSDGWNLMANPYPSAVDWDLVSSTLTGAKVYYVYDYQTKAYKYRNAFNGTGLASRYIPHSQSFFVKVNAAGQSLNYQESYKSNSQAAMERSTEDASFIAIRLSKDNVADESILYISDNAHEGYDAADAVHLASPSSEAVQLYFAGLNDTPLCMDSRPFHANLNIPLFAKFPTAGEYVLEVTEDQNLPVGGCLMIEDLFTGETMSLMQGEQMIIQVNAPAQANRFVIRGTAPAQIITSNTTCSNAQDGVIDVTTPEGQWSVVLTADNQMYTANGSVSFDHLSAGQYILNISNGDATCGESTQIIEVQEPMQVTAEEVSVIPATCANNDGAIRYIVHNAEWFAYTLRNENGAVILEGAVEGSDLSLEHIPADNYELNIYTTCETITKGIHLTPTHSFDYNWSANSFDLQVGETFSLVTELEGNAQFTWTINGITYNSNEIDVIFNVPGVYTATLDVQSEQCSCSEEIQIIVGSVAVSDLDSNELVDINQKGAELNVSGQLTSNNLEARVIDSNGRLVRAQTLRPLTGGAVQIVNVQDLSIGMYHMVVVDQNRVVAYKKFVNAQ